MAQRWLSAAVGIPLYIGLCLWGSVPFTIGVMLVAAVGLAEMLRAYHAKGIRPNPALASLGLLGPAVGFLPDSFDIWHSGGTIMDWTPQRIGLVVAGIAILIAAVWEVALAANTAQLNLALNIGCGLLIGTYIALFGGLAWLRDSTALAEGRIALPNAGTAWILMVTFSVWAADSFALFAGRAIGKHKLAPAISPNKTVEGVGGGLIAATFFGGLFGWLFVGSIITGVLVGVVAGIFGPIGDLFESALKRDLGIKDFGGVIPGHGGILDRFDSLIFVSSVVSLALIILARPEMRI